jgi:hypothetical protein
MRRLRRKKNETHERIAKLLIGSGVKPRSGTKLSTILSIVGSLTSLICGIGIVYVKMTHEVDPDLFTRYLMSLTEQSEEELKIVEEVTEKVGFKTSDYDENKSLWSSNNYSYITNSVDFKTNYKNYLLFLYRNISDHIKLDRDVLVLIEAVVNNKSIDMAFGQYIMNGPGYFSSSDLLLYRKQFAVLIAYMTVAGTYE